MSVRIQMRRDQSANWTLNNPILAEGEIGVELDTYRWKIGNGNDHWTEIPYANQIFSGQSLISDNSSGTALTVRQVGSGPFLAMESGQFVKFIVNSDGKVGIGTDSPEGMLDIRGKSIFVENSSDPAVKITQNGSGPVLYVEDTSSDTTPFIINADGNVGIGTDIPSAALDVIGNTRFTGQASINNGALIRNIDIGITDANTIDTSSGNLNIDSAAGQTNINDDVLIYGSLDISGDFNLNNNNASNINSALFNTSNTEQSAEGKMFWNNENGTLNLGLKGGNVTLQVGQETVSLCYNAEIDTLTDGTVVYISGSNNGVVSVKRASADTESASSAFGIVTENIPSGSTGYVTTFGIVHNLNTQGYSSGTLVYVDPYAPGQFTTIKPVQPNHIVPVGLIVVSDITNGSIFVNPTNGFKLDELHDVLLESINDDDIIIFDQASNLWINKQLASAVTDAGFATVNSPTFTGIPVAPTAIPGTSTTQIATTAFVSTAISGFSALPSQSGNDGKYLMTDGTNASWQPVGGTTYVDPYIATFLFGG